MYDYDYYYYYFSFVPVFNNFYLCYLVVVILINYSAVSILGLVKYFVSYTQPHTRAHSHARAHTHTHTHTHFLNVTNSTCFSFLQSEIHNYGKCV